MCTRLHHPVTPGRTAVCDGDPLVSFYYESSFSICLFMVGRLEMSGRACVPLPSPPWLYHCVLTAVRMDTLCIVLGCVGCQLSWNAPANVFTFFFFCPLTLKFCLWGLQPPCHTSIWSVWTNGRRRKLHHQTSRGEGGWGGHQVSKNLMRGPGL